MSHLYRDTGVVLRTYKLGEADRIVVLLTEENGKVRAVAKGVRKTTSKFGARLEPMSHVRLLLYRGRELDIVSQAESVEPLAPMLSSLDRASQGIAAIEAVDQLSLEREPNPQLYRMLVGVLRTIAARPSPINVPAFYWKLLAAEGLRPELDTCVRCGGVEPDLVLVLGPPTQLPPSLVWELAYAELVFTEVAWEKLSADDVRDAIDDFASRRRRFGGLDQ